MNQRDVVECPQCNREFSKSYARTFPCAGCSESIYQCQHVKSPYCEIEF